MSEHEYEPPLLTILSAEDFDKLLDMLKNPPPPSDELRELMQSVAAWAER